MHSRGLQIKVGLLVLLSLGILGGFIFALGHFSTSSGYTVQVDFNFVGTLAEGAPVKVAGIKIGKVKEIKFLAGKWDPALKRRVYVRLTLWIENRARESVRTDSLFYINTQGVLGEQYVEITPGNQDDPNSRVVASGDIRRGDDPPRFDLIISRLYSFLENITDLLQKERQSLVRVIQNGAKSLDTLERVLSENRGRISKTLDDADKLINEATTLAQSANRGLGNGYQIQTALANVNRVTAALARDLDPLLEKARKALDGAAELGQVIGPDQRRKIIELLDNVLALTRKADGLMGDTQKIVSDVRAGRGTAGALVMDREVYEDVKEMVRDLKRNPWKFFWKE